MLCQRRQATFVGFVCCVAATWLRDAPWLGVLTLVGCIALYAALGALIYLRNLPSIVVTLGMSFVWQGLAILLLPKLRPPARDDDERPNPWPREKRLERGGHRLHSPEVTAPEGC